MFEISNQWLLFVLDLSAKSLVLALAAGTAMKLFRLRNSNLRHRIWTGVLVGMLALPLLSCSVPAIPVSVLPEWNTADASARPEAEPLALANLPTFTEEFAIDTNVTATAETESIDFTSADPATPAAELATTVTPVAWTWDDRMRFGTAALFVGWLSVTAYFAIRLLLGLWSASRILNRAKTITDEIAPLSDILQGRLATVCQSDETCVPVTIGWFRPTILLPADWKTWHVEKLQAIVVHELTHIARRDFLVTIGAEINRCLYWFHPLSWWLRARLSGLAEHACDDAAIVETGDRTGYARHLLEVASQISRSSGRIVPGLAMARESNVESRIATILDFKRPLSERLTWKSTTLIALLMVPLIGTAAAVRAVSPDETSATGEAKERETAATETAAAERRSEDTIHIRGQVFDPKGRPVPSATLRVYAVHSPLYYASASEFDLVRTLTSGREGRFRRQHSARATDPARWQEVSESCLQPLGAVDGDGGVSSRFRRLVRSGAHGYERIQWPSCGHTWFP